MSQHPPATWDILEESEVADCKVYRVFRQRARHPGDGREGTFYIMHCPEWVQAIPLTTAGEVILVRQFRFGTRLLSWEVPGGVMDPEDTSPAQAAARELVEETGYTGDPGISLGYSHPNPALQNNRTHFILIRNCQLTHSQNLDANEELNVITVPVSQAMDMALNGEITHAIALNALFFLQNHLHKHHA